MFGWTSKSIAVLYKLCKIFASLKTTFLFRFVIIIFFLNKFVSKSLVNWIFSVLETGNINLVIFLLLDSSIINFIIRLVLRLFRLYFLLKLLLTLFISALEIEYFFNILLNVSPLAILCSIFLNLGLKLLKIWVRLFWKYILFTTSLKFFF